MQTDRLRLRPWTLDDAERLFAIRSNPDVAQWLADPDPWTDLIHFCDVLNNTGTGRGLTDALRPILDLDSTIWQIATDSALDQEVIESRIGAGDTRFTIRRVVENHCGQRRRPTFAESQARIQFVA